MASAPKRKKRQQGKAKKVRKQRVPPIAVRPQEHGGTLNTGGTNPGAGRPTNRARELAGLAVEDSVPIMAAYMQGRGSIRQKTDVFNALVKAMGNVPKADIEAELAKNQLPREVVFTFVQSAKVRR